MSKNSSAKYYRDNKERLQKRLVENMKVLLKKKKKKSNNIGVRNIKISLNMKNKGWLNIEKTITK